MKKLLFLFLISVTLTFARNTNTLLSSNTKSKNAVALNEQVINPTVDGFLGQSSGTFNTTLSYADFKRYTGFNREIYLTYNFSNLTITANSAKLKIFCQSFDKFGDLNVSLYCLPEYQTTGLTWTNRPSVSTAVASMWINQAEHANTLLEFDISSCLAAILATQSKQATFVLKITSGNDALVKFSMNESATNKPSVVLSDANPSNRGVNSAIKMPILFSDNMVLQRDKPIKVWGEVLPNLPVIISFDGQTYTTTCDANGKFTTFLPAKSASGSTYVLDVNSNNETFSYKNIVQARVCSPFPLSLQGFTAPDGSDLL